MTEAAELRAEIRLLQVKREAGDLPERKFNRQVTDRMVELCRAVVRERLEEGETLLAEHHVIHAHMRLNQSVLREPEQEAVSLFATDRRLLRLRARVAADRAPTCDDADQTLLDEVPLGRVRGLRIRRQVRMGELAAGVMIAAFALAFHSWLLVTGTLMAALGAAGVLHALLLPTRWMEVVVEPGGEAPADEILIHALLRKSARRLIRLLRGRVDAAAPAG
jgi:hypothetical protein